jgi:hypothetical protein
MAILPRALGLMRKVKIHMLKELNPMQKVLAPSLMHIDSTYKVITIQKIPKANTLTLLAVALLRLTAETFIL